MRNSTKIQIVFVCFRVLTEFCSVNSIQKKVFWLCSMWTVRMSVWCSFLNYYKWVLRSIFYQLKIGKKEASWAKCYIHGGKCMEATLFHAYVGKNYRFVSWDLLIFQLYNYFIHFCFFHLPVLIWSLIKAYRYINKNVNQQSQVMNDKGIKSTTQKHANLWNEQIF